MPRLSERTHELAKGQRDAALEAIRLRDQQRDLRAELKAVDAEQGRVRAEIHEAKVVRLLEPRAATQHLVDERIAGYMQALVDLASRATTLREALVRVGAASRTAQHEAGLAERTVAEAEARAVVKQM